MRALGRRYENEETGDRAPFCQSHRPIKTMESRGLSPVSGSERHAPVPVVRLDDSGAARAVAKHRRSSPWMRS